MRSKTIPMLIGYTFVELMTVAEPRVWSATRMVMSKSFAARPMFTTTCWQLGLPPGTTVPESVGKDPLVLEIREIRGHKSYGMLASPRELLLGDNHEGLLEVTVAAQPGDSFADALQLNDQIVELKTRCLHTGRIVLVSSGLPGN